MVSVTSTEPQLTSSISICNLDIESKFAITCISCFIKSSFLSESLTICSQCPSSVILYCSDHGVVVGMGVETVDTGPTLEGLKEVEIEVDCGYELVLTGNVEVATLDDCTDDTGGLVAVATEGVEDSCGDNDEIGDEGREIVDVGCAEDGNTVSVIEDDVDKVVKEA